MTLNYFRIIIGKRNIFINNNLSVDIRYAECKRTFAHFVGFKIIVSSALYLLKFPVFIKVFKLCYGIAVVSYLTPHQNSVVPSLYLYETGAFSAVSSGTIFQLTGTLPFSGGAISGNAST